MELLIEQFNSLLLSPTGSLLYRLVIIFSITASLQLVVGTNVRSQSNSTKRLTIGLSFLLVGQLSVFLFAALSQQNIINPDFVLPLIDRTVITFSILWLAWLWAFPQPNKLVDILFGLFNGLILVLLAFNFYVWAGNYSAVTLNHTTLDWIWGIFSIAVIFIGLFMLLLKQPETWGIGVAVLLINLTGIITHLFLYPLEGNYSLFLRIAMLCSFPLLPSVVRRNVPFSPFGESTSLPQSAVGFFNKNIKILA